MKWHQRDAGDQIAKSFDDFASVFSLCVEVGRQGANTLAVRVRDSRVERDDRRRLNLLLFAHQHVAFCTAGGERLPYLGKVGGAVGDRGDEPLHSGVYLGDLAVDVGGVLLAVGLPRRRLRVILLHQARHGRRREQLLCDAAKHAPLQLFAADCLFDVARARLAVPRAADASGADHDHRSPAGAAPQQAGQQISRSLAFAEQMLAELLGLVLRPLPVGIADDPQLRHFDHDAIGGSVASRYPFPAVGIALHMDAVVQVAPSVDRIAQHSDAALTITGQGGGAPFAASG